MAGPLPHGSNAHGPSDLLGREQAIRLAREVVQDTDSAEVDPDGVAVTLILRLDKAMREVPSPGVRAEPKVPPTGNHARDVATIDLGYGNGYELTVRSDCGVVKVYSSRDGCMLAVNPTRAREIGTELRTALLLAADATDRATSGGVR